MGSNPIVGALFERAGVIHESNENRGWFRMIHGNVLYLTREDLNADREDRSFEAISVDCFSDTIPLPLVMQAQLIIFLDNTHPRKWKILKSRYF